jgi:hypothetical protein
MEPPRSKAPCRRERGHLSRDEVSWRIGTQAVGVSENSTGRAFVYPTKLLPLRKHWRIAFGSRNAAIGHLLRRSLCDDARNSRLSAW